MSVYSCAHAAAIGRTVVQWRDKLGNTEQGVLSACTLSSSCGKTPGNYVYARKKIVPLFLYREILVPHVQDNANTLMQAITESCTCSIRDDGLYVDKRGAMILGILTGLALPKVYKKLKKRYLDTQQKE